MKFTSGIMAGVMLGTAAGMMASPMMSGRTRRRIARTSRKMMSSTQKTVGDIANIMGIMR